MRRAFWTRCADEGPDDDALSTDAREVWGVLVCGPPSDWGKQKPAAVSGAGFELLAMMSVCR